MHVFAWIYLGLNVLAVMLTFAMLGRVESVTKTTVVRTGIALGMATVLCGRVLGWW